MINEHVPAGTDQSDCPQFSLDRQISALEPLLARFPRYSVWVWGNQLVIAARHVRFTGRGGCVLLGRTRIY